MPIEWPKSINLNVLADAIDDLADRMTQLETTAGRIIRERETRITQLEHTIADHQAGATRRQREVDQLKADVERQAWHQRTGRRP